MDMVWEETWIMGIMGWAGNGGRREWKLEERRREDEGVG